MNKPQSKWTVLVAFVLAIALHIAPVAIVEMDLDAPRVEFAKAVKDNTISTAVD